MKQNSDSPAPSLQTNPPHIPEDLKIHLRNMNIQQQAAPGFHGPVHGFPDFHSGDKNQRLDTRSPHGLPPPGYLFSFFQLVFFTR